MFQSSEKMFRPSKDSAPSVESSGGVNWFGSIQAGFADGWAKVRSGAVEAGRGSLFGGGGGDEAEWDAESG